MIEYLLTAVGHSLCLQLLFIAKISQLFWDDLEILLPFKNRSQLPMYQYIRISSDGRGEMSINWRIQGIVDPTCRLRISDCEVVGRL